MRGGRGKPYDPVVDTTPALGPICMTDLTHCVEWDALLLSWYLVRGVYVYACLVFATPS